MEIIKPILGEIIKSADNKNNLFKRNLLKEYLQIIALDFIYSRSEYGNLVFYGGSCLAHCFGLPRLSEDLDFVDTKSVIDVNKIAADIKEYFLKNTDLKAEVKVQKFRIYIQFPILRELKLASESDSDRLFIKLEIFSGFNFCRNYKTEITPLFKFNRSLLVKTFDLPTLMSTKIRAILLRKWEKTDKKGKIIIKAKGRDYFDLLWYLNRGIKPNLKCIESVKNSEELKEKLLSIISKLDLKSVKLDLGAFVDDEKYIDILSKNFKGILEREVKNRL